MVNYYECRLVYSIVVYNDISIIDIDKLWEEELECIWVLIEVDEVMFVCFFIVKQYGFKILVYLIDFEVEVWRNLFFKIVIIIYDRLEQYYVGIYELIWKYYEKLL